MFVDGWHADPYGIHEERLIAKGEPTPLVRDRGIGSFDPPPGAGAVRSASGAARTSPGRQTKPKFLVAALLIVLSLVVGILGIAHLGGAKIAATTTTESPIARFAQHIPSTTTALAPQGQPQAPPTTTNLLPIEQALAALPRTTTPSAAAAASPAPSTTQKALATHVTAPPKKAPTPATSAPTTVAATTSTTSVGQADQGWYLAYGTVFNTVQTDIEKLDRAFASTDPTLYANLDPYWQELYVDANYAGSLPPIPDSASQSDWATALSDLSKGSTDCILGSAGPIASAASILAIFDQGSALVTTGTTQLDAALTSVEGRASATSASSRAQVRAWNQAHATVLNTLQTDIDNVNAAFAAAGSADDTTVTPVWQQLLTDAQSAMNLPPIPDPLIQSYWTTALNDLIDGSSDCLGSQEALPPNLFDQGVASIASGVTYLSTVQGSIQSLVG